MEQEKRLRDYELMFIIPNKYNKEEAKSFADEVDKFIKEKKGDIIQFKALGNKRLAYKIKGFAYGYYFLIEFKLLNEKLKDLNKKLHLFSEIIRYQIIKKKVSKKEESAKKEVKKEKEKEKDKKVNEKIDLDDLNIDELLNDTIKE